MKYWDENIKSMISLLSINIVTNKGHSVLDVLKIYSKVNCIDLAYEFAKRRDGVAPFVVADNSLALRLLEWKPKRDLSDMCKDRFRFIKMFSKSRKNAY